MLRDICLDLAPGCPRCGQEHVYELKDSRRRCSECGYTFHEFSLRWLNRCGLTPLEWLQTVDCFAKGLTPGQMATVTGLSYKSSHKAMTTIRLALLAQDMDARELLNDDNELRSFCTVAEDEPETEDGHCAVCLSPVFAVHGTNGNGKGTVRVRFKRGLPAREALAYPLGRNNWRTFIYTDGFQNMDGLVFACCKGVRAELAHTTPQPVKLDATPFWKFAMQWLAPHHCVAPETHPLYLKEAEFRYNHREKDTRPLLLRALCEVAGRG